MPPIQARSQSSGEMTGLVTATGMSTYFGKTARLVEQAKTVSHFQRAVLRIGNFLILVTVDSSPLSESQRSFAATPWLRPLNSPSS